MKSLKLDRVLRHASYWVLGIAFLFVSIFAAQRTFRLRDELAAEDALEASQTLETLTRYWETRVFERVNGWLNEIGSTPDIAATERRIRRSTSWFDAFYVWEHSPSGGRMIYPTESASEDLTALYKHPCLENARELSDLASDVVSAAAYRSCRDAPVSHQLLASSMAASLLLGENRPEDAWTSLNEIALPLFMPLHEANSAGISPSRLVVRRLQAASAQRNMGNKIKHQEILMTTVREIADMDGPQLKELLPLAEHAIPREMNEGTLPEEVQIRLTRAHRRLNAWEEIAGWLQSRDNDPQQNTSLTVVSDPYGERDYLLVYGTLANNQIVAIQLDPNQLLQTLPQSEHLPQTVVLNVQGERIHPSDSRSSSEEIWVQTPFGRLFPHLRAGLIQTNEISQARQGTWLISQLFPIGVALLLGGFAIFTRLRADQEQQNLLHRQRDFIARITHELKTPLAGIRLMVETIEMGAAENPAQKATLLQRILEETARLDLRIDEVLKAAKQSRKIQKTVIQPDEIATEVAEDWEDRFDSVGGILETDIFTCSPILGDEALLRDALHNLIGNALKYRSTDRDLWCSLHVREEGRWTIYTVCDNGIGVPRGMRKDIFQRFSRVETPGRGKTGGHGLGLAFVAETALAHEGSVECKEGRDGGSCFVLRIRRRSPAQTT